MVCSETIFGFSYKIHGQTFDMQTIICIGYHSKYMDFVSNLTEALGCEKLQLFAILAMFYCCV